MHQQDTDDAYKRLFSLKIGKCSRRPNASPMPPAPARALVPPMLFRRTLRDVCARAWRNADSRDYTRKNIVLLVVDSVVTVLGAQLYDIVQRKSSAAPHQLGVGAPRPRRVVCAVQKAPALHILVPAESRILCGRHRVHTSHGRQNAQGI